MQASGLDLQTVNATATEKVLGFPVTLLNTEDCSKQIVGWLREGRMRKWLASANANAIQVATEDTAFAQALLNANLLIPDGVGIILASKVFGGSIRSRVTGHDVFVTLNRLVDGEGGVSCFFLGSTEDTLLKISGRMRSEYPNIHVRGTFSPPFKETFSEEDDETMIGAINEAKPDILWVGMTAPKQEKWIYKNKERLEVKFIGAIGAVFDYYAGTVQRPHPIFLSLGLEWLGRLLREPRRLWRRYIISSSRFVAQVLKVRLFRTQTRL